MAYFVFQEIPFWNIKLIVVFLCYIVAMPDLLYKYVEQSYSHCFKANCHAFLFIAGFWDSFYNPCNIMGVVYKLSVKADLDIYSHEVNASGQCMSVSLILGFKLNFSSCAIWL